MLSHYGHLAGSGDSTKYFLLHKCDSSSLPFEVLLWSTPSSNTQGKLRASHLVSGNEGWHCIISEAAGHAGFGNSQQRARLRGKEAGTAEKTTHPEDALLLQYGAHVPGQSVLHGLDGVDQLLVEVAEEGLVAVELLERGPLVSEHQLGKQGKGREESATVCVPKPAGACGPSASCGHR